MCTFGRKWLGIRIETEGAQRSSARRCVESANRRFDGCNRSKQVLVWTRKWGKTWQQSLDESYPETVWRVNWNRNGCVLVVSYGMDGIDMWKERLDGKWEKVVNGSVSKEC